jgi:hypothetical protein
VIFFSSFFLKNEKLIFNGDFWKKLKPIDYLFIYLLGK